MIEFHAPDYLRNVVRIITETGLRVYKKLALMKKDQVNLENATVWIPDSKTANGVAEVPLTALASKLFGIKSELPERDLGLSGRKFHTFEFTIFAPRTLPG